MNVVESLTPALGSWHGFSRLILQPGTPSHDCVMTAEVRPGRRGQAMVVSYAWSIEGEPQEGLLVLNGEERAAGVWFESWHMWGSHMELAGEAVGAAIVTVAGTYPAGDGPDGAGRSCSTSPRGSCCGCSTCQRAARKPSPWRRCSRAEARYPVRTTRSMRSAARAVPSCARIRSPAAARRVRSTVSASSVPQAPRSSSSVKP